jgi:hypothetical protein
MLTETCAKLPKERQKAFMLTGWSKLKAHFKTGYRQIPQGEFTEALSIVARRVAEGEYLPAPAEKLSKEMRAKINRAAHATALRLYDGVHQLLTDCAIDNVACGASEREAMQSVEALASRSDNATIINVWDAQELVWAASDAINAAGSAISAIHRLEQRTGLQLAMRTPRIKHVDCDFHKHDRLVQEVIERMTGGTRNT